MRVVEYLKFRAELKRVPGKDRKPWVADAMEKANVADVANVLIGNLSKGYKQRVGLADALVARPALLVLDEPTAGLDPNQIREVRDVIRELGKEHTVLLSTHILSEVEASCSRVVVIARGRLVAEGTMESLSSRRRGTSLVVVVRGDADKARSVSKGIDGIAKVSLESNGDVHELTCSWAKKLDEGADLRATEALVSALVGAGLSVREVRPSKSSLEEVFAELTRGEAEAGSEEEEEAEAS
jgi:ABC-2 type transport system ATP-binding protein